MFIEGKELGMKPCDNITEADFPTYDPKANSHNGESQSTTTPTSGSRSRVSELRISMSRHSFSLILLFSGKNVTSYFDQFHRFNKSISFLNHVRFARFVSLRFFSIT